MPGCELLGEYLAAFQSRRCGRGPDYAKRACAKRVGDSGNQRGFGADDGEVSGERLGQPGETLGIVQVSRQTGGYFRDSCVSRCAIELRCMWAASEFPDQSVFASAG